MADLPEQQKDNLEAYPLRLNVSALPERRFFKMTRTLTVSVVLLASLLIALGVFLNYQITHLDVTIKRGSAWQFYRIDPEAKQLKVTEPSVLVIDPLRLATEERLLAYLKIRNSTVWTQDTMDRNFGPAGPIAQLSNPKIYMQFDREAKAMLNKTRGAGLIREAHIYSLKWLHSNLWMAIIETFDLPITDDLVSVCTCSDNSHKCIQCKIDNAQNRERKKIWMRTSFDRTKTGENPLGVSVDEYIPIYVPIHDDATYWDLPPDLQPDI